MTAGCGRPRHSTPPRTSAWARHPEGRPRSMDRRAVDGGGDEQTSVHRHPVGDEMPIVISKP